MRNPRSESDLIQENIRRHDAIAAVRGAKSYEVRHTEIYNPTEQRRLRRALATALQCRQTGNPRILDFGCGPGNLTEKLLGPGREVWATDVSSGMVELLRQRFSDCLKAGQLRTETLTGDFPLPFPDRHFGFVCTYSVLHHVPDYLAAVRELVRVLDVGGVLYLDHEASADAWRSPFGVRLYRLLSQPYLGAGAVLRRLGRLLGAKRPESAASSTTVTLPEEGDIHIFADDCIDWTKVRNIASGGGLVEIGTGDYLLCEETARFPVRHWICRHLGNNMGIYAGIKRPGAVA